MNKFLKTFILTVSVAGMGTTQAFADIDCATLGGIRSVSSDVTTRMTFKAVGENDETQFKIYWLNFEGKRQEYKHLFAGETYTVNTYLSHPWLITAPVPGGGEDCIGIYLPRGQARTVVLD